MARGGSTSSTSRSTVVPAGELLPAPAREEGDPGDAVDGGSWSRADGPPPGSRSSDTRRGRPGGPARARGGEPGPAEAGGCARRGLDRRLAPRGHGGGSARGVAGRLGVAPIALHGGDQEDRAPALLPRPRRGHASRPERPPGTSAAANNAVTRGARSRGVSLSRCSSLLHAYRFEGERPAALAAVGSRRQKGARPRRTAASSAGSRIRPGAEARRRACRPRSSPWTSRAAARTGLAFRRKAPADGMLLVFRAGHDGQGFWMMNTLVRLQIVFPRDSHEVRASSG